MKYVFRTKKIEGVTCVFYANEEGSMWFAELDGKKYGNFDGKNEDMEEQVELFEKQAQETLQTVKSMSKQTL